MLIGCGITVVVAGVTRYAGAGAVFAFVCSAVAVALLASLVGRSVDRLGNRLGAGATGVLQSALGNLPELFIGFFALRAGLVHLVQGALIGSILANLLLVLGAAFVVGGLRHGTLRFSTERIRSTCALLALATAALVLPTIATYTHTPAADHAGALSARSRSSCWSSSRCRCRPRSGGARRRRSASRRRRERPRTEFEPPWPHGLAVGMLAGRACWRRSSRTGSSRAEPAMQTLHVSQAFAGLVVVAIASNAIENVVGIQLAAREQAEYAISVIVNSPLQIALVLAPALVLLSLFTRPPSPWCSPRCWWSRSCSPCSW